MTGRSAEHQHPVRWAEWAPKTSCQRVGRTGPSDATSSPQALHKSHETQPRRDRTPGSAGRPVAGPGPAPAHPSRSRGPRRTTRQPGRAAVLHRGHRHHPHGPGAADRRGDDARGERDAPRDDRGPAPCSLHRARCRPGAHAQQTPGPPRFTRRTSPDSPGSSGTPPAPSAPGAPREAAGASTATGRDVPARCGSRPGSRERYDARAPGRPPGRRGTRAGGRN